MTILYTTCPTRKEAEKVARTLVEERLVACVNLWPVRTVYRWPPPERGKQGKIKQAAEWVLWCKTRNALAARVERRIRQLASYEMPVMEQWVVKTDNKTRQWVDKATRL